jgi:peptidoglycan hydrolase-like protein with peptidoglycan-binding domain
MFNGMKKYIIASVAAFGLLAGATVANASFDKTLSFGAKGPEVITLQEFLISQGHLQAGFATGNFLSMTEKALKAFQTANGIESIGIFGPKTRAAANALASGTNSKKAAIVGAHISNNSNSAAVGLVTAKTIGWTTQNYPAGANVSINLLKKTSTTPNTYTLVRQIAKDVANSGSYVWLPQSNETGTDLYVEVICQTSAQFTNGCTSSGLIKVN